MSEVARPVFKQTVSPDDKLVGISGTERNLRVYITDWLGDMWGFTGNVAFGERTRYIPTYVDNHKGRRGFMFRGVNPTQKKVKGVGTVVRNGSNRNEYRMDVSHTSNAQKVEPFSKRWCFAEYVSNFEAPTFFIAVGDYFRWKRESLYVKRELPSRPYPVTALTRQVSRRQPDLMSLAAVKKEVKMGWKRIQTMIGDGRFPPPDQSAGGKNVQRRWRREAINNWLKAQL